MVARGRRAVQPKFHCSAHRDEKIFYAGPGGGAHRPKLWYNGEKAAGRAADLRWGLMFMYTYLLGQTLAPLEGAPEPGTRAVYLLTSQELDRRPTLPGLEGVLHHTPSARDARVCKAEARRDCLCGTVVLPRRSKDGGPLALGYLLTGERAVLCDDTETVHGVIRRLAEEKKWRENGPGRFFCELLEGLLTRDLHYLEELEDQLGQLEDQVLAGQLEGFNAILSPLRKQALGWFRCYNQLDDVACELEANENGFFSREEQGMFHMLEKRLARLRDEAQLLREYCLQVRELFQAEIDIRQNRIMKILTIVTTIFLPLSLVAGWYGMNFTGMPELGWRYGYPGVIAASALILLFTLWLMKKKKFW